MSIRFTNNIIVSGSVTLTDESYSSNWDGKLESPTKNALWDLFGSGTNFVNSFNSRTGTVVPLVGDYSSFYPLLNGTNAIGTWSIDITGNSGSVTNGVYTTGNYSNPNWITALDWSKITNTPIADYIPLAQKGAANGVTPLGVDSKVPAIYLPSYVDDILEFANLVAFPAVGDAGIIYIALDTNKSYRWGGSSYVEISPSEVNSVFGRTGIISALSTDYSSFYPLLASSYNNPSWINQLAWSKIIGTPTTLAGYGITDAQSTLSGTGLVKSTAGTISYITDNSANWNTAYGWGNHAGLYPLYNGTGAIGTWGINITGNSATVTTNANLTGVVTSIGNTTSIADSALSIAKTSGLQTALDAKLDVTTAASTYQTLANLQTDLTASATKYPSVNAVNTVLSLKANLASPTFTGTVTIPTSFVLGATTVTTTGAQLNFINTLSSNAQTQIDSKQATLSGTGIVKSTAGTISYLTDNSANWNTAFSQTLQWNGGATNLVAATGRTSLGGTTVGQSVFTSTNPTAITFLRANADNTVTWLSASDFRTAIGTGTVTSVSGTANQITVTNGSTTPVISLPATITGLTSVTSTGFVGALTGNATTATTLSTPRTIGVLTGDVTSSGSTFDGSATNTNATTLATVNSNVGSFGSATQVATFTVNAKGLTTAAANVTITPAIGSITGLGTGVSTALGVNIGTAGSVITNGGALGTPSSGVATNLTGTASALNIGGNAATATLASTVTTNANLTGVVTSVGNATSIADAALSIAKTSGLQSALDLKAPLASPTFTGTVTISTDIQLPAIPVNGTSGVTKNYVDNAITGLTWKPAVRVATTTNITLSGTQTIDGVAVVVGDRVLVKNQTTASANGIYIVAAGAWTRATDADTGAELTGATVYIMAGGTVNGGTQWSNSNTSITLGTTNVTFIQIAGAGVYTNGTGLTLTGNIFAIDSTVATLTGSQTLTNKTISGASNTLSNIANASLTNSSLTIGSTAISLGGTSTTLAGLTSVTSTSFVGALTGNASTVTTNANLTGVVTSVGNATSIADAALSIAKTSGLQAALDLKAPLASPTFTGTPTLPTGTIGVTQTAGNSSTALATTAFVTTADSLKANIASPTFTGTVTIPTPFTLGATSVTTTGTQLNYLNIATGVTGTGSVVLSTSPTFVSPALGTPSSGVATNLTGTAAGLTAGTVTTNANLTGIVTSVGNATAIADGALSIAKTSGLQSALDLKAPLASPTFTGTVTLPTASFSGTGVFISNTAATTSSKSISIDNTSGALRLGVESSAGGSIFTAGAAYETVFGTSGNTNIGIFQNNTRIATISPTGLTLAAALSGTTGSFSGTVTAPTFSGALSGNASTATTAGTVTTAAQPNITSVGTLTGLTVTNPIAGSVTGTSANVTGTVAIANGGTGQTTAPLARTALGATTVGGNIFTSTNPTAITFLQANADNTVSWLDATTYRTAIGAGTGNGTVTSVAALTLGTTGTDLSSSVATGTTTPVITLNVPTASASNRGVLSSADWSTFNAKAPTASPAFTGVPTAPTAAGGTNTAQIATTAFVLANVPSLSATSPIFYSGGVISSQPATSGQNGYLTSTDWTTFNNKLSTATAASTYLPLSGGTLTGALAGTSASFSGEVTTSNILYVNPTNGIRWGTAGGGYSGSITSVLGGNMTISNASGSLMVTPATTFSNAITGTVATLTSTSSTVPALYIKKTGETEYAAIGVVNVDASNGGLRFYSKSAGSFVVAMDFSPTGAATTQGINLTGGGIALKNAGNTAQYGGLTRSGNWEGNANNETAIFAETGFGVNFYSGGSATVKGRFHSGSLFELYVPLQGTQGTFSSNVQVNNSASNTVGSGSFLQLANLLTGTSLRQSIWQLGADGDMVNFGYNGTVYAEKFRIANATGNGTFSGTNVTIGSGGGAGQLTLSQSGIRNWILSSGGIASGNFSIINGSDALEDFGINGGTGAATFANTVTATAFYESSDLRYKDIISRTPSASGFDMIAFKWKPELKRDSLVHYGYGAQEVQKVMPDQIQINDEGYLSVNYIDILVKKVADLEQKIKQLERK